MTTASPCIGIIADSSLQGHLLTQAVRAQGFPVAVHTDPENLDPVWLDSEELDLWMVDLTSEDRWQHFLDDLLENAAAPILFCDGQAPDRAAPEYPRWERRLLGKMLDYVERPRVDESLEDVASHTAATSIDTPSEFRQPEVRAGDPERVWVLGASLGGPAAVKEFLDCLPAELPVAFVLAQHIDAGFLETLTQVLVRDNGFECRIGYEGERLRHGHVILAPVEHEIGFSDDGSVRSTEQAWEGPYAPSIDQVINNVATCFDVRSGAILFSGMGNDGSISGPLLRTRGAPVWAQTPDSCAASSQPDSARETGCVSFSGSPEELARQLVEHVRREIAGTASPGAPQQPVSGME
jgi:chemosensory pili system protein ChpB (putative protein-glutamate methylesterase)